jgi:hypothetical protein
MAINRAAGIALEAYVSSAPTEVLQCRTGRHDLPYLNAWHITRPGELQGNYQADSDCRNGCGTHVTRIYDRSGYSFGSTTRRTDSSYDYDVHGYGLSEAVLELMANGEITRADLNAACRRELMFNRSSNGNG